MLRRISSDAWKESATNNATDDIFIDRNGARFQYVLDYMRDSRAALPLTIPRSAFVGDLEFLSIDNVPTSITLSSADPNDLFHGLAAYRNYFDTKSFEIDARYRKVAAEKLACTIAKEYFSRLVHKPSEDVKPHPVYGEYQPVATNQKTGGINYFGATIITVAMPPGHQPFGMNDLDEHLQSVGLKGSLHRHSTSAQFTGSAYYEYDEIQVSVELL